VSTAVQEAGLRAQIAGTQQVIALERESLAVMRRQLDSERSPRRTCIRRRLRSHSSRNAAAVGQAAASDPDQLAVLTGQLPATSTPRRSTSIAGAARGPAARGPFAAGRAPPDVALPRRSCTPHRQVGVAIANLLPQVTITAISAARRHFFRPVQTGTDFGASATATQTLFAGAPSFTASGPRGGARSSRSTVPVRGPHAFQNVPIAPCSDRMPRAGCGGTAASAAERSLSVSRRQLELGSVNYLRWWSRTILPTGGRQPGAGGRTATRTRLRCFRRWAFGRANSVSRVSWPRRQRSQPPAASNRPFYLT